MPFVSFNLEAKAAEGFVVRNLHEIYTKRSENFLVYKRLLVSNIVILSPER